jgi:hypothetical protein
MFSSRWALIERATASSRSGPLLDRRGGGFQRFDPACVGEDAPRITAIPAMGQIFPDGVRITYQFIAKSR